MYGDFSATPYIWQSTVFRHSGIFIPVAFPAFFLFITKTVQFEFCWDIRFMFMIVQPVAIEVSRGTVISRPLPLYRIRLLYPSGILIPVAFPVLYFITTTVLYN
jgi:hypothetical protein